MNLTPLKKYPDFRLVFFSQLISYLGNMVSYVVVPYQVYHLTKSSFMVGLLGFIQLFPVFVFGLLGGSFADRVDRRVLLIVSEILMALCAFGLVFNAHLPEPNLIAIFVFIFILQSASAYHRPAIEAMIQKMVAPEDFPAVAALGSLQFALSAIIGPAFGGWAIYAWGISGAYLFDFITFVVALLCALLLSKQYSIKGESTASSFWNDLKEGLHFARKNRPLLGSYAVDIIAMTFAFPIALFPEIVEKFHYPEKIGWLYAGMAIGALFITVFFADRISSLKRRGLVITFAAGAWGIGIILFGVSLESFFLAIVFLAVAGAADTISGLQRKVLWNELIPNSMRGRLAGLEMISYLSGPLLGNFRAGTLSGWKGPIFSIVSGGILCAFFIAVCAYTLPTFWKYEKPS